MVRCQLEKNYESSLDMLMKVRGYLGRSLRPTDEVQLIVHVLDLVDGHVAFS